MLLERTAARSILSFGLRSPKFQVLCNAHRYFASAQKFPDHIPFQGIPGSRFFPCPVGSLPPFCNSPSLSETRNLARKKHRSDRCVSWCRACGVVTGRWTSRGALFSCVVCCDRPPPDCDCRCRGGVPSVPSPVPDCRPSAHAHAHTHSRPAVPRPVARGRGPALRCTNEALRERVIYY